MFMHNRAKVGGLFALAAATPWLPFLVPASQQDAMPKKAAAEPLLGGAVISEVLFDPVGPDDGTEWVEIALTKGFSDTSLDGYTLENEKGDLLYSFPPVPKVEVGATLVVALGEARPAWERLNVDGGSWWFLATGTDAGNQLGDASGAVVLRAPSGTMEDYVCWGEDGPPTNTQSYWEAVVTGHWSAGDHYDTSFDGPSPCFPDQSVGRNMWAVDTNRSSDWGGNGGRNAVGQSPGQANNVDLFNVETLLSRSQEVVNKAFFGYGISPQDPHRFSLTDSDLHGVKVEDLEGFSYAVTADHSFDVLDRTQGLADGTWSGELRAEFSKAGPRAWRATVSGKLTSDAGETLDVWHSQIVSHGTPGRVIDVQETKLSLSLAGQVYPLETDSTRTDMLVGPGQLSSTVHRSERNWGGAEKFDVTSTSTFADQSDTKTALVFQVAMPHPAWAYPPLGGTRTGPAQHAVHSGKGTIVFSSPDDRVTTLDDMTLTLDGAPFAGGVADDPVTFAMRRLDGVEGDAHGTIEVLDRVPFQFAGTTFVNVLEAREEVKTSFDGEKVVRDGTSTVLGNGQLLGTMTQYVDPPRQTIGQPPTYSGSVTDYGTNRSGGGGPGAGVVKGTGDVAIVGVCVWAGLKTLPAAGAGVVVGGACALGAVIWGWFF